MKISKRIVQVYRLINFYIKDDFYVFTDKELIEVNTNKSLINLLLLNINRIFINKGLKI